MQKSMSSDGSSGGLHDIEIQVERLDFASRHNLEATSVSENVKEKETLVHPDDQETRELRSRARALEKEIMYLKEQIVLANTRQFQALNGKYALEREFSELQMALDEKQTEVSTSVLNELARRKGDLEVNLNLRNELKIVNDEKQVFASAALGILVKYGGDIPRFTNASTLSNSIKHLHDTLLLRIRTSDAILAEVNSTVGNNAKKDFVDNDILNSRSASHLPRNSSDDHGFSHNSQYIHQHGLEIDDVSNYAQASDFEHVKILSRSVVTTPNIPRNSAGHNMFNVIEYEQFSLHHMMHDGGGFLNSKDEAPGIEGFQIIGEAKPGGKLLACGYPINGTSLCMFQWVRHYPDGTKHYIEGATNPDYILTDEDVDKLIAVECTPMDEQGRQGEIVRIFANDNEKIKCASFVLPHETWRSELENDSYERVSFTPTDVPFDSISESSTLKIHDVKSSLAETIEVMTQEVKGTEFTKRESKMLDYFNSDALATEEPESLYLTYGREIESTSPMESEFASSIYDTLSLIHHESTSLHDKNITITISATGKLHEYADLELIILHDSLIELQHANRDIGNLDLNHYRKNNYYLFLVKKKQLPVDQQSIAVSNQSLASLLGCQLSSVLPPHFLIYERFATEKEWSQACVVILTEIDHLVNSLTSGPYHCSDLAVLFLQGENTLSYISSSFFNFMPVLRFLDLSGTRSRTLPSSLFTLTQLQVLLLRNCPRLVKIPTEIENLRHVQVLDLSGTTELHYLPVQVGKLTNLKEFQVSLYGPDNESEHAYLPPELLCQGILSKLQELEALSIVVHPEDHRWRKMASDVTQEIIELKNLRHLQFYFPEIENLETFIKKSPSWNTLRTFKLVVGHDVKRIAPRVPDEVVFKYNQLARCVRFVNGDRGDLPQVIKKVVAWATAFCLDHHLKVHSLSQFGISNLKELKFCVVRECPNFKVFAGYEKKNIEAIMPSLEFLGIHYLWKLQRIWSSVNMAKGSFNALKHLTVYTCPRLKFILPASILPCLISLEELVVADCEAVTRITKGKVKNDVMNNTTTLPNLRKVELHNLLRLVSLGNGISAMRAEIVAVGCPSFNQNVKPVYSQPSLCC